MERPAKRWSTGQDVYWTKVKPYTISQLIGEAGNIHISEIGRFHVYWHRDLPNGRRTLVHHGGEEGFPDLASVKHQHERVILRYIGFSIDIPPEENFQGLTFPQIIDGFEKLIIPGEQQQINDWLRVLQNTIMEIPRVQTHGNLSKIREDLDKLLQGNLGRSINKYKMAAADNLRHAISGSRPDILVGATEAQKQLLLRSQETVAKTLGTMQRYNVLERQQLAWNDIVRSLPRQYSRSVKALREYSGEEMDRVVDTNLFDPEVGVFGNLRLADLKGEPYFSKAREFIGTFNPILKLWEARNIEPLANILTQQATKAELWWDSVKQQYTGVDFGRYKLAS